MKLLTFISDCEGGTYVSQHRCASHELAMSVWLNNMPHQLYKIVFGKNKKPDIGEIVNKMPIGMMDLVAIEGLIGVWGGYVSIRRKDIFVFVVETRIDKM